MRLLKWGFAALAVLVASSVAFAGWQDWTERTAVETYPNALVSLDDGSLVRGTFTIYLDYRYRYNDNFTRFEFQGHNKQTFVSNDGTITGRATQNQTINEKRNGTLVRSDSHRMILTKAGEGRVGLSHTVEHMTINANGDLAVYFTH